MRTAFTSAFAYDAGSPRGKRMRILLIEDNAKLARTIKESLEQQGYCADVAATAGQGDELAVVEHYDVIVLDVMLPGRDGLELCRSLRRQKVATPILMLTALGSTADKVAGLDAGADDYLTKPFQLDELLARLRSLMRRSTAMASVLLCSGGPGLGPPHHPVTTAGSRGTLSP